MNKELENKLVEKYPVLFRDVNKSPTETLMCFGCECGDGWYNILDDLFGYLTDLMTHDLYIDYNSEYKRKNPNAYLYRAASPKIILTQVKEKYGTLRVYYYFELVEITTDIEQNLDKEKLDKELNRYYDKVDNAISFTEYRSSKTCEETGEPGKLYTKGWYRTLCDEKAKEYNYI